MRLLWRRVWTTVMDVARPLVGQYERMITFEQYLSHAGERPCLAVREGDHRFPCDRRQGKRLMGIVSLGCWFRQTPRRRPCVNVRSAPNARSSGSAPEMACSRVWAVSRGSIRWRVGPRCFHASTIRLDRSRWMVHAHSTINRTTTLSGEIHRL